MMAANAATIDLRRWLVSIAVTTWLFRKPVDVRRHRHPYGAIQPSWRKCADIYPPIGFLAVERGQLACDPFTSTELRCSVALESPWHPGRGD